MIEHSKPAVGKDELDALKEVIATNYPAEGWAVRRFEDILSDYIGAKGAVATSTGTLALHLALLCLGIKPKDEIILPSYACRSLLNAVLYTGARPVVCDVNIADYNISFTHARIKLTRRTKAIIIPHMFGCPAEIDKFKNLGVPIIEDCAHSIGAEYKGRKAGSWGDLSVFSFEGTKYITTGEGGMVLVNSRQLLEKLKKLKEPESFDYKIKYTYRMSNLQAAMGIAQLSKLKSFIEKRRKIARAYTRAFLNVNIALPKEPTEGLHIFHRYVVKIKGDINQLMQCCYKKGIKVKQPIKPYPLHRYVELSGKNFPNTEYIMKSAVSIPIYPSLANKEIQLIIDTVRNYQSNKKQWKAKIA
jgi:dTDP-4-amino-4,6-dideoxygalactose transaminase